MIYDCVIVGGGASGLCCAASLNVNKGLILEASPRLGAKLLLSGGGRCNVTHSGSIKDFIPLYGDCGRTLRSVLYTYNNLKLISELESCGIPCSVEADGRVFPSSGKASDVLNLLLDKITENRWQISTVSKLISIDATEYGDERSYTLHCSNDLEFKAHKLVIACGGITYPRTGSDGSALKVLERDLGTCVTALRSALAPIEVAAYPYSELAGISLENAKLSLHEQSGKRVASECGSILFAHREFSGPAILNISRHASVGMKLRIDCSDCTQLPKRFLKLRESYDVSSKKKPTHRIDESVDEFIISSISPNGMVTVGGVSLDEINPKTMELKSQPGIYVIGEALDIDGPTGGYNLQLCYSTAKAAAASIKASYLRP